MGKKKEKNEVSTVSYAYYVCQKEETTKGIGGRQWIG